MIQKICLVEVEGFSETGHVSGNDSHTWKAVTATDSVLRPKPSQGPDQLQSTPNTIPNPVARNHADARLSLRRFAVGGAGFGVFFASPILISDTENCHAARFGHPHTCHSFQAAGLHGPHPEPQGWTLFE
jgi:hypothetical protein